MATYKRTQAFVTPPTCTPYTTSSTCCLSLPWRSLSVKTQEEEAKAPTSISFPTSCTLPSMSSTCLSSHILATLNTCIITNDFSMFKSKLMRAGRGRSRGKRRTCRRSSNAHLRSSLSPVTRYHIQPFNIFIDFMIAHN